MALLGEAEKHVSAGETQKHLVHIKGTHFDIELKVCSIQISQTDQTVLASRKLDITKIILKQLNSKLSELKVEIPKK